jgi:hypothetical protein
MAKVQTFIYLFFFIFYLIINVETWMHLLTYFQGSFYHGKIGNLHVDYQIALSCFWNRRGKNLNKYLNLLLN